MWRIQCDGYTHENLKIEQWDDLEMEWGNIRMNVSQEWK